MRSKFLLPLIIILLITSVAFAIPIMRLAPLTYAIKSRTTTVSNTATPLPTTPLVGRESIAIRLNATTDTVCIGASDVTTANGFCLDSSIPSISLDLDDTVIIYGIVGAGTADVRTLEIK